MLDMLCHAEKILLTHYFCTSDADAHSEDIAPGAADTGASRTVIVPEEKAESPKHASPEKSPRASKKKKSKLSDAGKGVFISENPAVPPADDVSDFLLFECCTSLYPSF